MHTQRVVTRVDMAIGLTDPFTPMRLYVNIYCTQVNHIRVTLSVMCTQTLNSNFTL